jgi:hypothetical protein
MGWTLVWLMTIKEASPPQKCISRAMNVFKVNVALVQTRR